MTYTYTAENMLESVTSTTKAGETKETYTYDAEGNRLSKTEYKAVKEADETTGEVTTTWEETDKTYYVIDVSGAYAQVIAELDADKEIKVFYTRGDGIISREEKSEAGESSYNFYLSDGHGDVRQLTGENGVVTDSYSYNSFGELKESQGETDNPYLYTGEYYDEGTGLYYLRARYMNPETGTFTSMDTYRGNAYDPASLHRYTYAQNNPQMYTDPSGHSVLGAFVEQKHNMLIMSAICGLVSNLLNEILGRPLTSTQAFAIGAATGLCMMGAYIGMTVIQVLSMLGTVLQMHFTAESAAELVVTLAYGVTGNDPNLLRDTVWATLRLLGNCLLLGLCMKITLTGPRGAVSIESTQPDKVAYYEYKALRQQGYTSSEAFELMKQFRNGINPNNEFVYHFTTMKGGEGITNMHGVIATRLGVAGSGVYAGTTPTPSWLLKHIPFSGWGLGSAPVRISIKLTSSMQISDPLIPFKTVVIEVDFLGF